MANPDKSEVHQSGRIRISKHLTKKNPDTYLRNVRTNEPKKFWTSVRIIEGPNYRVSTVLTFYGDIYPNSIFFMYLADKRSRVSHKIFQQIILIFSQNFPKKMKEYQFCDKSTVLNQIKKQPKQLYSEGKYIYKKIPKKSGKKN
eukprot:TRINITY_DN153_c1_g1_i9.p2 TRINITY_DN153_c1_g1~~TRINITY_DN153_c1_g1_i9.p2  ORF type:complete len:144 (-),score=6.84 TRINITY_DN153_c1_g1_i9:196-627(-)